MTSKNSDKCTVCGLIYPREGPYPACLRAPEGPEGMNAEIRKYMNCVLDKRAAALTLMSTRERLAALCHEQWTGWMQHLFGRSVCSTRAGVLLSAADAQRWRRQVETPYQELSAAEKDSDRKEADRFTALISAEIDRLDCSAHFVGGPSSTYRSGYERAKLDALALLRER